MVLLHLRALLHLWLQQSTTYIYFASSCFNTAAYNSDPIIDNDIHTIKNTIKFINVLNQNVNKTKRARSATFTKGRCYTRRLGTGQKVWGEWAGAFGNVVDKKHMAHPPLKQGWKLHDPPAS